MTNSAVPEEHPPSESTNGEPSFVMGIGASAGGLEALEQLFGKMPVDSGAAFVVVQHLSPDFKSMMDELLSRYTKMAIHLVENGMRLEANALYLIPPRKNMVLENGHLVLTDQESTRGLNLPIDIFFSSLAKDQGGKSVGVILSGTGSDGSRGIVEIRDAGGFVAVQSTDDASFDGMPKNAIATGRVQLVCSVADMPGRILSSLNQGFVDEDAALAPIQPGEELSAIFASFRKQFAIDFSMYRDATLQRRIERRMHLSGFQSLLDYARELRNSSGELEILYRDLLVEVTAFFRDGDAFAKLREEVVLPILQACDGRDEIRVWVAGCATGEEAYSLAMLFYDAANDSDRVPVVKVFATDVHRSSLEAASAGIYSGESLSAMPEDMRDKYFKLRGSLYHISGEIRKMVIFAPHNMAADPPFTRLDLITCRNVLIYLKPEVQQRVLAMFHFGLKQDGFLFLGSSETLGDLAKEFDPIDSHWRIFRKLRDVRLKKQHSPAYLPTFVGMRRRPVNNPVLAKPSESQGSILDELIDRFMPTSFLVNRHHELMHSFGKANRFLVQPKGRPTLELPRMLSGDLRIAVQTALLRASNHNEKVVFDGVRIESVGEVASYQVTVEPFESQNEQLFSILLHKEIIQAEVAAEVFHPDQHSEQRIQELERDLQFSRQSLQASVEELETSNEELQSTNEELTASNEELQSTNEELHTVNEELYTVNSENQRKIEELSRLTADMDNLIESTNIGTIFLDKSLRIRRFTPAIQAAFDILEQDVGRPIGQFAYHFDDPSLIEEAQQVLATGEPHELSIRPLNSERRVYLKRTLPYRVGSGQIDGVIITFTDITSIHEARESVEKSVRLSLLTEELQEFIYAVSHDLQAPARQIEAAVRHVFEDAGELDPNFQDSLTQIASRSSRLGSMLACLLEYSRVHTRAQDFATVGLRELYDAALLDHMPTIQRLDAHVKCFGLPTLNVDHRQIQQVFWHLIDNALKYSSPDRLPNLEISTEQDSEGWTISFVDNGIGIAPRDITNIFVIFRRLEDKPKVQGMGFGLALAKRIMQRHEGTISVSINEDHGCTFSLRFPVKK